MLAIEDKRQIQQQLHGITDIALDSSYDDSYRSRRQQERRPEDNPYNAGNRNVDYPTRNPNNDYATRNPNIDERYNSQQAGTRKPAIKVSGGGDDDHCEGCDGNGIPGEAGVDYPIFASLPKTNFDCKKQEWPGYYADTDAKCQVFWICQRNKGDAFLCPNGTLFNQQVYVCDWWYNVDCAAAPDFYSRNQYIYAGPGIDLFGNQITVKQSTSVSSQNNDFIAATTRRPQQQISRPSPAINDNNSNGRGQQGQTTREILQAIESAQQTGTGGNAYRREISHRDDSQGSYSTTTGSRVSSGGSGSGSTTNPQYVSTYSPSRQVATTVLPYETYKSSSSNNNDNQKYISASNTAAPRRYEDVVDVPQNYGYKKPPQQQYTSSNSNSNNNIVYGTSISSRAQPPRENQIQNPFVKQSSASSLTPSTSPRRSIASASGVSSASGSSSLAKQQNYYSTTPSSQQPQQTQLRESSYSSHSQRQQYNDHYSKPSKNNYSSESSNGYLPTPSSTTIKHSTSSRNPFITSSSNNNNYKSNQFVQQQQQQKQQPSSYNQGGGNFYLGGSTTKRNILSSSENDFENDDESGFKFNFAKTISYSPVVVSPAESKSKEIKINLPSPSAPSLRGADEFYKNERIYTVKTTTTTPKSTIIASSYNNNNNVKVYHHDPIIIPASTTTKKTPVFSISDNNETYDVKIARQSSHVKANEPSSFSARLSSIYDHDTSSSSTGRRHNSNSAFGTKQIVDTLEDNYPHYKPQTAAAAAQTGTSQHYQQHHYNKHEQYSTTTNANSHNKNSNFQGGKIITKYDTKTSYNDGDDENYVDLLRSLAKIQPASTTSSSNSLSSAKFHHPAHSYDSVPADSISSPVVQVHNYDFTNTRPETFLSSAPVKVHNYDFVTTSSTSTISPPIITTTTTSAPLFGKKIKTGRKRNSSNWQDYFFKSKKN